MKFINPPAQPLENVTHRTFFSRLYGHEIGFNIYLPPDYEQSGERYPVAYHFHGWQGNESSEVRTLETVYTGRRAITVFPNSSPVIEDFQSWPVESMIVDELIPLMDGEYRTKVTREDRSVSGFSMGGGMAFVYAVRHPELFGAVTAYAGTYHHYFHKDSRTVREPLEKAAALYESMINEKRYLEDGNILHLVRQNAAQIRGKTKIMLLIGSSDVLICDNEILHLDLISLNIPHEYTVVEGVEHNLADLVK